MNGARRTRIPAKAMYSFTLVAVMAFAIVAHAQSAKKISGSMFRRMPMLKRLATSITKSWA
jgi:hypothetical protein